MQKLSSFKNKKPVIAIDGTAGSGKGSLAKKISQRLDFDHLDSGILYRAFAFQFIKNNPSNKGLENISFDLKTFLKENRSINLRTEEISKNASIIAKNKIVRERLISVQREFVNNPPGGKGSVVDGRDISTVIVPNAEIKLYIDANIKVRAKRRQIQLELEDKHFDEILETMTNRDKQDKTRKNSPLKKSKDSFFIETSNLDENTVFEIAMDIIKKKTDFI